MGIAAEARRLLVCVACGGELHSGVEEHLTAKHASLMGKDKLTKICDSDVVEVGLAKA
jgi:hypothetical protein